MSESLSSNDSCPFVRSCMRGLVVLIGRVRSRGVGVQTGFMMTGSLGSSKRSECIFD